MYTNWFDDVEAGMKPWDSHLVLAVIGEPISPQRA